jgi:hypothetical protein
MDGNDPCLGVFMKTIILTSPIAKTLLEFQALPVSKFAPSEANYDSLSKVITFKANEVGPNKSWRLIHNDIEVIDLFLTNGITTTIYRIFEADSEQKCLDEIKQLHLSDKREFKAEETRK